MNQMDLSALLRANLYPGRGILLGRSVDGRHAIVAYFIMGRSENSRNRVFIATQDGIRTQAHNPAMMTDPSLIIYHPVRMVDGTLIVTNGDQTDTIAQAFHEGTGWVRALRTRAFEPDAPNYTPRISGMLRPDGGYRLSILKSADGDPACCQRFFYEYDIPLSGQGHIIHTYLGDGTPLPCFEGEPRRVALDATCAHDLAQEIWANLDADNKVSLYVSYLALDTGEQDTVLINKHQVGGPT